MHVIYCQGSRHPTSETVLIFGKHFVLFYIRVQAIVDKFSKILLIGESGDIGL